MKSYDSSRSHANLNEFDLVTACKQRSPGAFEELYKRYRNYVLVSLRQLGPDMSQNYDDLLQELFVRVWKSIGNIRDASAFKPWLRRMITNLFYDQLKGKREQFISLDAHFDESESTLSDWCGMVDEKPRPDECLENKETIAEVKVAFNMLPKQFRTVLVLREFGGFSYAQIANATKTDIGTVKSRVARGRAKVQSHLERIWAA